jgi:histidine triad (HIT) family protein
MQDSIFTKIIKGEIPSYKIYEDDKTFAFLDINPLQPGHTLVISKRQVEFMWDLSDEEYQAIMSTAKKVAARLKEVLHPKYIGEQIIGVDVPHAHIHLVPFNNMEEFKGELNRPKPEDHEALAEMAKKLAF